MRRGLEVAIRKAAGAARIALIVQFLGESSLMALLGLVLAAGMVESLLPLYDRIVETPLKFEGGHLQRRQPAEK